METQNTPQPRKSADWKFIIGLTLLLFGYGIVNTLIYFVLFGLPFYLVGALLIGISRVSTKAKLLIIGLTLLINLYTYMLAGLLLGN